VIHAIKIVNGGIGYTAGQITGISLLAAPGPIVGAGLPGLLGAMCGLAAVSPRLLIIGFGCGFYCGLSFRVLAASVNEGEGTQK
jgi:hypothetical protein